MDYVDSSKTGTGAMSYVKWVFILLFWGLVAAFLHYTLPQHDIARITDTYEKRVDPGNNRLFWAQAEAGSDPAAQNRDVFFIQTKLYGGASGEGRPMVYRNEDTAWGWPPYFKFNTSNLQAVAADLKSTAEAPRWVVIRHYGWRAEFLSVFPNAVSIRPIEDPEQRIIPWLNIVILLGLFAAFWAIRVRWLRFWERRVDPALASVEDRIEDGSSALRRLFGR
jgi:hypothetical protein